MSDSENEIGEEEIEEVEEVIENDGGEQEEHEQEVEEVEEVEEAEEVEEEQDEEEVEDADEADNEVENDNDGEEVEEQNNTNENAVESDEEEFAGFGEDEIKAVKNSAKRKVISDDEAEEDEEEKEIEEDAEEGEQEHDEVVQDVDEEVQENEIENEDIVEHEEEDEEQVKESKDESRNDDDSEVEDERQIMKKQKGESDIDALLNKNKKKHRRKNADSEALTNMDSTIASLITEMKNSAAEDRAANEKRVFSMKKLKMLDLVTNMLQKQDHHSTMIELGILGAMAEWLAPLPDRSLPNIKIRETLINSLQEFGEISVDDLKSSGIGKATMFLYKHPKEIKANKEKLEKLIHNWSRPIFNLDSNYKQLTKEERQERDMNHVKSLNRRASHEDNRSEIDIDNVLSGDSQKPSKKQKNSNKDEVPNKVLRPGDPGFCPRARVPLPSSKDYVVRPKANVDNNDETSERKTSKKTVSRLDKHKRRFIEMKRASKTTKAIMMSIEGKKLPL